MALTILVSLLYLMPLFDDTPIVILAAIIITAIIGLIDYGAASHLFKTDKLDFLACLCSFFGVLFISVAVSLFKILLHITRPNIVVLRKIKGTQIYQDICCYQQALRVPSFLILGVGSPIYFANSNFLQDRILLLIQKEDELLQANNETKIKCLILDMSAVTAIDTSGLKTISQIKKMLENNSLQFVLASPVGNVTEKLQHSKVLDSFSSNGLYLTVGEAVIDISSRWNSLP